MDRSKMSLSELYKDREIVEDVERRLRRKERRHSNLQTGTFLGAVGALMCGMVACIVPASLAFIPLIGVGIGAVAAIGCGFAYGNTQVKDYQEKAELKAKFPEDVKAMEDAQSHVNFEVTARDYAFKIRNAIDKEIYDRKQEEVEEVIAKDSDYVVGRKYSADSVKDSNEADLDR